MRSEFDIKMTTKAMYNFLMYHTYHTMNGIFSVVAGLALIVFFFVQRGGEGQNTWMFLLFGVLFIVYLPWTLYLRAAKQAKLNAVFQKPLHYELDGQRIRIAQGESSSETGWDTVRMVRKTRQSLLLYTTERNAFIWIKDQMGAEEAQVRALICKMVKPECVKLKK